MDLRLENLSKRFGNQLAVEIPSLTIPHGEFFTFVGPSGCGKSTTLNLIAGLEQPSTGTLLLGDRLLNDQPPHKRDVAFVFQSYALYPHRTAFQNLAFPLELARVPRGTIGQRVQEVASLLGLTSLLGKRPYQLSGGERQRVALGRAIIRQPKLFLFDEPLSNLDAPLRAQMQKELKRLHEQLGTTFIYVTHDQEEALSLSDRIAVMQAGRIQQCGSPSEIYDHPANQFVASFFGRPPMNFLEGELYPSAGATWLRIAGYQMRMEGLPLLSAKAATTVGIRPEDVQVSREPLAQGWFGKVLLVELHGGQTYLELETEGFPLMAVERAEVGYRRGEKVWATAAIERLHLFNPQTGERNALP
jgi:multiple sugar transport system ATP-binding protein